MKFGFVVLAALLAVPAGAAQIVGGDRDAHGCIGSAGYSWCAKTTQCERPWELAKAKGFRNSQRAFTRYCGKR